MQMVPINSLYGEYFITTDKRRMDEIAVHKWLSESSYWAKGLPFGKFKTGFDHSFCIGALMQGEQVGYGRLITDYATFAYLADVYVLESHRGKGISKQMMKLLFEQDWVKGLRRIMLATTDAHVLYRQIGFTALSNPEKLMEIVHPNPYPQKK
jgi:GNAT superfamily N-acetyltransferase